MGAGAGREGKRFQVSSDQRDPAPAGQLEHRSGRVQADDPRPRSRRYRPAPQPRSAMGPSPTSARKVWPRSSVASPRRSIHSRARRSYTSMVAGSTAEAYRCPFGAPGSGVRDSEQHVGVAGQPGCTPTGQILASQLAADSLLEPGARTQPRYSSIAWSRLIESPGTLGAGGSPIRNGFPHRPGRATVTAPAGNANPWSGEAAPTWRRRAGHRPVSTATGTVISTRSSETLFPAISTTAPVTSSTSCRGAVSGSRTEVRPRTSRPGAGHR